MGKMKHSEVREIVYNRYHGRCAICGKKITLEEMTIDHIVPSSKGGGKDFANMQCTCDSCNLMKHYLNQEEFMRKLWKVTLHNMRNILRAYTKKEKDYERGKKEHYRFYNKVLQGK